MGTNILCQHPLGYYKYFTYPCYNAFPLRLSFSCTDHIKLIFCITIHRKLQLQWPSMHRNPLSVSDYQHILRDWIITSMYDSTCTNGFVSYNVIHVCI